MSAVLHTRITRVEDKRINLDDIKACNLANKRGNIEGPVTYTPVSQLEKDGVLWSRRSELSGSSIEICS